MPDAFEAALAQRLHPWGVKPIPGLTAQLSRYYALLERWNQRINLTSLPLAGFPDSSIDRLLVEPLLAARQIREGDGSWFDFGSGGGSPAVPMKIVHPGWRLAMVEARQRKTAFLREVVRQLDFANARVLECRIEQLSEEFDTTADLVTVRAIQPDSLILDVVRRVLRPGGRLMAFGWQLSTIDGFDETAQVPLPDASMLRTFLRR